ncbi:ubiquitin carboxyl-terminal hydrolase 7 [Enteropsectra breve]|nr:ubiquitin carboxyl-terminal hydrolase 7 [Enteropsectra breve]
MHKYCFSKEKESSQPFTHENKTFRLSVTPGFVSLEYTDESYGRLFVKAEIEIIARDADRSKDNTDSKNNKDNDRDKDNGSNNKDNDSIITSIKNDDTTDRKWFVFQFSRFSNVFSFPTTISSKNKEITLNLYHYEPGQNRAGLDNYGATCYANSFIQTLYSISEFKKYIFGAEGYHAMLLKRLFYQMDILNGIKCATDDHNDRDENNNVAADKTLPGNIEERKNNHNNKDDDKYVFKDDNGSDEVVVDNSVNGAMYSLLRNLSFVESLNIHTDIHEFSKILFDKLENEDRGIKALIDGELLSVLECSCGCRMENTEVFQDITVNMEDSVNILASLDKFCGEDKISGYKCDKHGSVDAVKTTRFKKLPPVLFVLISRFAVDWNSGEYVKSNKYYEYYDALDLSAYSHEKIENDTYRLYAVNIHSGTVDKGHFYCYIELDGHFYKFDDETVYEVSREEAIQWNYGGQHPGSKRSKRFSGYYLVYLREDLENRPMYDMLAD